MVSSLFFLLLLNGWCMSFSIASHKMRLYGLEDARLCNNAKNDHQRSMCKYRKLPDMEAGEVFRCDYRILQPEQCQVAELEATPSSLPDAFASLPNIDENRDVRRIIIRLNSTSGDVEVGHHIDEFLKPRLWWYVTSEPYTWSAPSNNTSQFIVLSRVQHQFEPSLRMLSALQFPESPEVCRKSPLLLHRHDFKHPGWYSMLFRYSQVHRELPHAVTAMYISSSNSVTDSTSFVSAEDCPNTVNKWECAFLPATSCALPAMVTRCNTTNCVTKEIADTIRSTAIFDSASEDGKFIAKNSPELAAVVATAKTPPSFNKKWMDAVANLTSFPRMLYGQHVHPQQTPFLRYMCVDIDYYTQALLLRHSAFYRSRIAETIHRFRQGTGFGLAQRCVAAQIRRGDRARAQLNVTEFCLNPAHRHSDLGCASVPFALVTLRHVVESAAKLVDDSVRSLVVTTDDELWLDAQREMLRRTHPDWRIYSLQTPNLTAHASIEVALPQHNPAYEFMRHGAGTASGVLLHGSIELSRQCEAFVGHFGCGGTMLVYKAMCARSNHRENVCPPVFDVRTIEELIVNKTIK